MRLDDIETAHARRISACKERVEKDLRIIQAAAAALPKDTFKNPEDMQKHIEKVLSVLGNTESDAFEAWPQIVLLLEETTRLSEMILQLLRVSVMANQHTIETDRV
jgi:hypothetical protein